MTIEENIYHWNIDEHSTYTKQNHTEFKTQKTQIDEQIVAFNRASKFNRFYFCGILGMVLNPSI